MPGAVTVRTTMGKKSEETGAMVGEVWCRQQGALMEQHVQRLRGKKKPCFLEKHRQVVKDGRQCEGREAPCKIRLQRRAGARPLRALEGT